MSRRYAYETTLDLNGVDRDVRVTFECPDHEEPDNVAVVAVDGFSASVFQGAFLSDIAKKIEADHRDALRQEAIRDDAERWAEDQDRRDEAKAERNGWRV